MAQLAPVLTVTDTAEGQPSYFKRSNPHILEINLYVEGDMDNELVVWVL